MSQARAGPSRPRPGPAANVLDPFGGAPAAPVALPALRRPPRPRRPSARATGSSKAPASRIAAASERLSAVVARLFRRHGASVSRHPIRTLLLCCLFITSLFYPAAGIYLFASQGGPGLSRSDTTSVWRTLSTPLLDSFASSGRTHLNSLRDLRMVWDDAPDLSAKDPRDTVVQRGRQQPEPQCARLEHVLVTTDDVMRGTAGRGGVLQAAVLNSAQRLQAALEARLAGEAAAGTAQAPRCVRTPTGQCLTLSPLDYWQAAALPLQSDATLSALLEPQHNVSSRGVPLALTTTLAGRGPLFSRSPRAEFLVLSFWLQDPACGADEGQHDAFRGLLDDVASGTRIVESELRFEKEVVLRFVPDAAVPKLRKVLLGLGYLAFVAWIALGLVKVRKVHSPWGLAFTGTIELLISTIMSVSICALSGLRLTAVPWEILPFVIVLVGSENMFVLTDAIVSTPLSLTVPARIGAGLNAAGVPIAVTVVSDVALMALIAAVVGVPAVREFCLFAICSLVVDFFMQMTFFVTVLSIDLQRLELADLLAQGGRGQAEPIGSPDEQDDTAVDSEDEDADALQPSSTRGPQPSSGRSERTDSYLKMSCKAAWRARTARTATLSGLLAALFGLYLYYGTGYQAEGVHGPTLPFAEAYPSSSVFGSQDVRPTSTHLSSQTFDPLAHLPSDAEQSVQQPWWQSSPSAPFWQALNPRGAPYVRIVVAPWTIVSLRGATSVGPEHARPVAFAAWALFRPRVRALIWFFKLSVLPIAGTTGLLWVLLLYLLKDTELLYAQEDKEDALFDDSATDRGAGDDSDREAAPPLKVQLTAARALHGSDVDYVAQDGDTVVSVAIDSSISVWRVGGPARSVASLHQTPSPGSAVSARAPQATCAAVDEAADLAAVGFRSGAISVLLLSSLAVVASATPTTSPVQHVCFVPRSDKGSAQLVSAHRDGSAYVWPAEHGASPGEVVAPRSEASWTSYAVPLAAAFSASMQQSDLVAFASSSSSLELRHWRAGRLESVFSLVGAPRALYRCVALSSLHFASSDSPESTPQPASRSSEPLVGTVLCGTLTGAVQAWDLSSSQLISSLDLNDGAILSLQVLPSSDAGSAPSDVALACTATSAFLLRLSGAPHAGPASELGISPGRPLNGLTLPSSPSGSRAGLPHLSGMRRPSDAGSQMMTPSNSGRVRSGSRPSSAGTGSLNAAGHVVGTETASTGVAPSPRSSRFRTSTDRVSLDVLDALRDGVLPGDSALRAIRREPIKRGGAVLARDPRGEPVVLGVRRRQAEDASRWELWHLQNAGCAAPQVYASESDLETSLLELESEEAAHPEADAPDASSAPAWPSLSLRPTALNGAGPSAMPLSFTRLKPVLLSTRGTSSIAAPQDTPPALLLGFGNSLAHVVPLRQNAGVVTLPDNSRASSELAGAQHMRRRGARRPSDYGI